MAEEQNKDAVLITTLQMISDDMERDARGLDGKPFNGNTVATQFGNNCAAIKALADILRTRIERERSDAHGYHQGEDSE